MMSPRERLIKSLNGQPVDRPPFICPGGMMNMVTTEVMCQIGAPWPDAHTDPQMMADLALGVHRMTGIENLGVPFCMTAEAEALGATVMMGDKVSEPRVAYYPLEHLTQWTHLPEINPDKGRIRVILDAIKILSPRQTELPLIANLTGPVSLATSLVEPMSFYKAMGKQPLEAHLFLSFLTKQIIIFGQALLRSGAQVVTIADPSGTGEILGPRRFEEFALPYLNSILESLESSCQASMVHICGRLHTVFGEIKRLKTGAISIDSATSVTRIKEAMDSKVIVGNVSTHMLLKGTPDRVKAASLSCLEQGAAVLSPACGISPATPLANLRAMAEAAKEFNSPEKAGAC